MERLRNLKKSASGLEAPVFLIPDCTGLLEEPPSGVWRVFSSAGIDVEHKKKVDLGVLRDADCHGLVAEAPFTMVGGVDVKSTSSSR